MTSRYRGSLVPAALLVDLYILNHPADSAMWAGRIGLKAEMKRAEQPEQLPEDNIENRAVKIGNTGASFSRDDVVGFALQGCDAGSRDSNASPHQRLTANLTQEVEFIPALLLLTRQETDEQGVLIKGRHGSVAKRERGFREREHIAGGELEQF